MRGILTAAVGTLALMVMGQAAGAGHPAPAADPTVTPVSGPSWLHHLGVDIRETTLGRGAGRYGPNPNDPVPEQKAVLVKLDSTVTLSGSDLYRLNCQSCHRADGTGAPPDVKSMLPMVQGSTRQQVTAALRQQAEQMRTDLYARIEKGGQRMPPREYMLRSDIDVLFTYLTTLAGRSAGGPMHETVSVDRLGEFVVKGTCHICHDASGPRPMPDAILVKGSIPSLASLLADRRITEVVSKVRTGSPVWMGNPPVPHRGRMPVFYYLMETEIAAASKYLSTYPPK